MLYYFTDNDLSLNSSLTLTVTQVTVTEVQSNHSLRRVKQSEFPDF